MSIAALLSIGTFVLNGCNSVGESKDLSSVSKPNPTLTRIDNRNQSGYSENKRVSFRGVEFYYGNRLADNVAPEDVPEYLTPNATSLKDSFDPRHLEFKFSGALLQSVKEGWFQNKIDIYSLEDAKKSARRAGGDSRVIDEMVRDLRSILSGAQVGVTNEYPFFLEPDAIQVIHAHTSVISFTNGRGICYLTQFNSGDPYLINNSNLLYVFQGLTDDNRYLISATFHVRTSYLPDDRDSSTYKNYKRPDDFYSSEHREQYLQQYKAYLVAVEAELENTIDDEFQPSLTVIREMLASLAVRPSLSSK